MRKIITRLIYRLPKKHKQVWYNRSAHISDAIYPIIYDNEGHYIGCREGLLVVMKNFADKKLAYYKVVKIHRSRGGDWLYDSDRIKVDLEFSHVKTINTLNK